MGTRVGVPAVHSGRRARVPGPQLTVTVGYHNGILPGLAAER